MDYPEIRINLQTLTDRELLQILKQHTTNMEDMLQLMSVFFDLFSCALHFGGVLQQYAERKYPDFSFQFEAQKPLRENHDVPPKAMLQAIAEHLNPSATYLH